MNSLAEKVYASINAGCLEKQVAFRVTEKIKKGSVMARSPDDRGIVIDDDLPRCIRGSGYPEKRLEVFFYGRRVTSF